MTTITDRRRDHRRRLWTVLRVLRHRNLSAANIAHTTGLHVRTVQRCLRFLHAVGRVRRYTHWYGRNTYCWYWMPRTAPDPDARPN